MPININIKTKMSATPTFQFRIFTLKYQHQSSERFLVILVFILSFGDNFNCLCSQQ